jgi:hypothetical protein
VRAHLLQSVAIALGLGVGLFATLPLAHGDAKSPTIGVDEIREGMKGYGLTVFHGYEPEKFDVEVIGVLHNFRPSQDLILVKTPHPRLNITKNVQGMSGSPIYFDGRLAGAYAYSLRTFMTEPVAGVTPIAPMLTELHRPIPPGFWPLEGRAPLPAGQTAPPPKPRADASDAMRFDGAPGEYDALAHAKQISDRIGYRDDGRGIVPVSTPLLVAGLGDKALGMLRQVFAPMGLEPLQAGGGTTPAAAAGAIPSHFVDGGSLGVQLTRGDVSMMGLGTVTHVEGTRLCGFGHPMMSAGDTAMPTALGRVLWIYASDQHSFKVGEAVKPLGTLVNDRQSSVIVDETKVAPTFPVHVVVKGVNGAVRLDWHVEAAEDKFSSASLAATVLGGITEATIGDRRDLTWAMHSKLAVRGHGTVELDDFGVAIGGMPDAGEWFQARVVRTLGDSLNNPWENVHIDGIESTLTVDYGRDVLRLRGVDVLDPVVDAGEKARFVLHLRPFSGNEVTKTVELPIPAELAGRDVEVEILPGYDVGPDLAAPESLDQLLRNSTRQSFRPQSVVVQVKTPAQGVAFDGMVAPVLPRFALDALRPQSTTVAPEPFQAYARTITAIDTYLEGRDKVKIKVRPKLR